MLIQRCDETAGASLYLTYIHTHTVTHTYTLTHIFTHTHACTQVRTHALTKKLQEMKESTQEKLV